MILRYALVDVCGNDLFLACMDDKVVYAAFVDIDNNLGVAGSYCVSSERMRRGVAGMYEFLQKNKFLGINEVVFEDAEPDYEAVKQIFDRAQKQAENKDLILYGTQFQKAVWGKLLELQPSDVASYSQIANELEMPKAVRAVGNAIARNHIAYLIPCHRVIRADGGLGGFKWGTSLKGRLLEQESQKRIEG